MMNSLHGERGAVNILFLVVVLVIALAFVALWFTQLQENEQLVADANKFRAQAEAAESLVQDQKDWFAQFASFIGAGVPTTLSLDPAEAESTPIPDITEAIVEGLRRELNSVGDLAGTPGARPATLREAWDIFTNRIGALKSEVDQLKADVTARDGTISGLNDTIAANQGAFDSAIATANQEKADETNRLSRRVDQVTSENDDLQTKVSEAQDATEAVRRESQATTTELLNKTRALESEVAGVKSERTLQRAQEGPDGKIITVDNKRGIAFLDIGARDQLHAGLRFKVYGEEKAGTILKGYLRVTKVEATMAEARIEPLASAGVPMEKGDWVTNPVFRKDGSTVNFLFLGQLPGRFNRETAEQLLREMGGNVQDKVTVETDFLVLGQNESEDDIPLTESDDYQNARRWGITIITEKDLTPFLRR